MTRLVRLGTPIGLAALAAGIALRPPQQLELLAFAVLVLLLLVASPVTALAFPFVIVQILGENFRLPFLPLAVTQASFGLVALAVVRRARAGAPRLNGAIDRAVAAFGLSLVPAIAVGILGGAQWEPLKQDIVPFAFLLATYVATRIIVRTAAELDRIIAAIVLGTLLAAMKVGYLLLTPVAIEWESQWQGVRLVADGLTRIILRGADVFFVVTALFACARLLSGRRLRIGYVLIAIISCAAAFFAGTRSNWIGFAAGLAAIGLASAPFPRASYRAWTGIALAGAAVLLVLASSDSLQRLAGNLLEAWRHRQFTTDFRKFESTGAIAAIVQAGGLGNGFGSTYRFWDNGPQEVVESVFNHNGYLQLVMKTGVVGLIAFLFVVYRGGRVAILSIRAGHPWRARLLGLFGGVVGVLVLSIGVNKIFALSGAMLLGFAFAIAQTAATQVSVRGGRSQPWRLESDEAGAHARCGN